MLIHILAFKSSVSWLKSDPAVKYLWFQIIKFAFKYFLGYKIYAIILDFNDQDKQFRHLRLKEWNPYMNMALMERI